MAENDATAETPVVNPELEENKENQGSDAKEAFETELKLAELKLDPTPSADIDKVTADLFQSRSDLLGRVQNLKKDLQEWRGKLDSQVKTYRQELGELRSTLNSEVEQLRDEFQALRSTLKRQLDATTGLTEMSEPLYGEANESGPDKSSFLLSDIPDDTHPTAKCANQDSSRDRTRRRKK